MSNFTKLMQQAAAGVGGADFYPYTVNNSARFNDDDIAYLYRVTSTPDDATRGAISFWVKRGNISLGMNPISCAATSVTGCFFQADNTLNIYDYMNGGGTMQYVTNRVFRDTSAWYHILLIINTNEATALDRVKLYVNGVRETSFSTSTTGNQSASSAWLIAQNCNIGRYASAANSYYDGYLAEVVRIDGTVYSPTDFGEDKNGVWIPKNLSSLSFGSEGFYIKFDNSGSLGTDSSGNGNNFTTSGLASTDQMIDTPTNNFMTAPMLVPRITGGTAYVPTMSEGNLKIYTNNSQGMQSQGFPQSGKWYFECTTRNSYPLTSYGTYYGVAVGSLSSTNSQTAADALNQLVYYTYDNYGAGVAARFVHNGVWNNLANVSGASGSLLNGDILAFAVDMDNGVIDAYVNNVKDHTYTLSASEFAPKDVRLNFGGSGGTIGDINFGQNGDFNGFKTAQGNSDENGIGDFYYTPPSGYLAVCSQNMPELTIGPNSATTSDENFHTVLYTGNGTAIGSGGKTISDLEFQPDFTWIKNRDAADSHMLFDAVRGATKYLNSDISTNDETTDTESLTSFTSNGFTLGNNVAVNTNAEDYVAWNWKANGSGVTNNDGDVTSTVSVNNDAGVSLVKFTTPATGQGFTIGHGMDKAPDVLILRGLQTYRAWWFWHKDFSPSYYYLYLSDDYGFSGLTQSTNAWNNAVPTSTVFSTRSDWQFGTNVPVMAWCFAEVEGFSKFGSYTGNGSSDGPMIFTNFRPAWVMVKKTNAANDWAIWDGKRSPYNVAGRTLLADLPNAEYSGNYLMDFLSNGFKLKNDVGISNDLGSTYIYMAFAENPFKYANAR